MQPRLAMLGASAAQRVEVVAVDLERDLRPHARQHVVEAVRDRLADVDAGRQHGEPRADVGQHLLAAALRSLQVDVELAVVDALGMLVELGAARAAADRLAPPAPAAMSLLGDAADAVGLRRGRCRVEACTLISTVPSLNGGRKARGSSVAPNAAAATATTAASR